MRPCAESLESVTSMTTTRPYVANRIAHSQRLARETVCPKCRAPVLVGPDHDRVAHLATVDASPVDGKWEIRAHGVGRQTYDLDNGALCFREPWHASNGAIVIYVSHVCR